MTTALTAFLDYLGLSSTLSAEVAPVLALLLGCLVLFGVLFLILRLFAYILD